MPLRTGIALVILSVVLAAASVSYQRVGPTHLVEGEGFCPGRAPCRIPALGGGFPLPFVVDNPQISVPNALSVVDDEVRWGAFAADVAAYLALGLAAFHLAKRRRRSGA